MSTDILIFWLTTNRIENIIFMVFPFPLLFRVDLLTCYIVKLTLLRNVPKPALKVKVTLRLTVGQSVSLGVELHLGLMTRYLLLFDRYGLVFVGRPL
jgi:hypothetical protein